LAQSRPHHAGLDADRLAAEAPYGDGEAEQTPSCDRGEVASRPAAARALGHEAGVECVDDVEEREGMRDVDDPERGAFQGIEDARDERER
jgi:hypothetical protein